MLSLKLPRLLTIHQVPKVLPMEAVCLAVRLGRLERPLHLALPHLHGHLLPLPAGVQLCPHLQHHVWPSEAHLLFLRLWCSRLIQPRLCNCVLCLHFPRRMAQQHLAPWLHLRCCAQHSPEHESVLLFQLYLCASRGCSEHVIPIHYRHIAFAFFTCFVYATHLPERLVPGLFDFIGHSHQLFHICGVTGTHFQMEALLIDMTDRRAQLLAASPMPSFSQTVSPLVASLTISLFIIAAFSMTLYSMPKFSRRENKHRD